MADRGEDTASAAAAERTTQSLNHFGVYRFTKEFWGLSADQRGSTHSQLLEALEGAAHAVHPYQLFPMESAADLMIWTAVDVEGVDHPKRFFEDLGRAMSPFRGYLEATDSLWGFTRPSQYSRAKSAQEMDPFPAERAPYLVVYPFTKTIDWYLLGPDTRQGMMNEHIRIGKQYTEISQLLLYSSGLQDQEFVVVYETEDLSLFSQLVRELRDTEARRYTKADTPVHTGLFYPPGQEETVWSGS
ncbi:MAG: chlorite dismutase family protein [Gemmatimonadota bacterium]